MYYPSSENKGADQLRGYREADLRLCFRIMQIVGFPMRRLNYIVQNRGHKKTLSSKINNSTKFASDFFVLLCQNWSET